MITKCQRITIYKMLYASACYPVAKSHQDSQGSQSEQLRTLVTFSGGASVSGIQCPHVVLTDGCVTMLSYSQGCELSDFALIL